MIRYSPIRIKIARHRKQLSMDELVARMGGAAVSKMSISKIERGLMNPSEKIIRSIASACDVPVSFFNMSNVLLSPMCFRYEKDISVKKAKKIEAEVTMMIEECYSKEQMANYDTQFVNPFSDYIIRTYNDAEDAARLLRHHIVIGNHPIHSVYEMLSELGVMVVEVDLDCIELLGTSTVINNNLPVVVINTRSCTTTERKRFTALHELAHLMFNIKPLSEEEYCNDNPDITLKCPTVERLCHRFASAMLITPSNMVRRLGDKRTRLSIPELISIRCMYGISIAAAVHRAHDLGIISDTTYNELYDSHINKNKMEIGWGEYPIMEKADRYELLEERLIMETTKI